MSVTTVKEYLKQWNKDAAVREFEVSSATVELAAQALGVEPARIAKTLSFSDDGDGCILIVAAGDAKIDNAKFKTFFHRKARMLSPDEVIARTGHAIGGVCPFAITNPAARIWLDESLKRFATVFPACGSSNSAIELSCAELEICSRALGWIDVCKGWTEPPIIC